MSVVGGYEGKRGRHAGSVDVTVLTHFCILHALAA